MTSSENGSALTVRNDSITLMCDDNGANLMLRDEKRNLSWSLDPLSMCGRTAASEEMTVMNAVSATKVDTNCIKVTMELEQMPVTYTYRLNDGYVEVSLSYDVDYHCDSSVAKALCLPGSFTAIDATPTSYALPIMQGMLWDGGGSSFQSWRAEGCHTGFSMPIVGYVASRGGLLLSVETQDDSVWWLGKSERTWVSNVQLPSLGRFSYDRICRLYPTDASIVDIAKTYRRRARERGRLVFWDEKLQERPGLERLFGALMCFIGYCEDTVDYVEGCRALVNMGFDRALVYPCRFNTYHTDIAMGGKPPISLSTQTVSAIKELGYDVAPWSWLNEALDDGTPNIRNMFRRGENGNPIPHWAIDSQRWFQVCSGFLPQIQRLAISDSIADCTWDHFDVLACASIGECHASDHPSHMGKPLSKSEDRDFIRQTLLAGRGCVGSDGRAVSSESFNDAYAAELDLASVKAWPRFGEEWSFKPVPLTMLVYHDSVIHSWWEIHNYNNPHHYRRDGDFLEYGGGQPKLMAAADALMGCPPDVFPFGSQYVYTGNGNETSLYSYRLNNSAVLSALEEALPVAKLHRRIGKLEMTHFGILRDIRDDCSIQESVFSDGTRVIANFSDADCFDVPGIDCLPGPGWRVT